jgi:hypothetical protein
MSVTAPSVLATYARQDITFVSGEGCWLTANTGERYLDLVAGIAVVGLGHRHPAPLAAAHEQLDRLWHVSNLYWTDDEVAARSSERFGGAQASSQLAPRRSRPPGWYGRQNGKGVVALNGSFRPYARPAVVTASLRSGEAFEPLVLGDLRPLDDIAALRLRWARHGLHPHRASSGEGGIHPASQVSRLRAARRCDGALPPDEVRGAGRTLFCFERYGVTPTQRRSPRAANGLPIGRCCRRRGGRAFEPGDYASVRRQPRHRRRPPSTRSPTTCSATSQPVSRCARRSGNRGAGLCRARRRRPRRRHRRLRRTRVLVGTAGPETLRITPPLTIAADEFAHGLAVLEEALAT